MPQTRVTRETRETHDGFPFVDAGRTFTCRVEPLRPAAVDAWWWFRVCGEVHARFAPFRAAPVTMGWGRRPAAAARPTTALVPAAS